MTREESDNILLKATVEKYPTTHNVADVIQVLLEVFNDKEALEAQLKAKEEGISKYQMAIDKQSKRAEALKQLSLDKDKEIERLKEFEEMVEWMELNSNRSLCDYYNNKDNS